MVRMPTLPTHSKIRKRTALLLKRNKSKSFKPLYKKLKSNNDSLAKALSQQKHECQTLFNENVALTAQLQQLGLACTRRDEVLANVAQNAKEMLKLIGTLTNYFGSIISSCQQFKYTSDKNALNASKSTRRSSVNRRLSTKSPARGVVQPMVSGHMITKPTINLSRVNMQHLQNAQNLSVIEESPATTPRRSLEQIETESSTPARSSLSNHLNSEDRRAYRLPERLNLSTSDDEDVQTSNGESSRLSKRRSRKYSRRSSGKSVNNGISNDLSNSHTDEIFKSPRVELNDVSKLLRNSQSINIRRLTENSNNQSKEHGDLDKFHGEASFNSTASGTSESNQSLNSSSNEILKVDENNINNASINNSSLEEDPLEGPSWKYNNISPQNNIRNMRGKKKKGSPSKPLRIIDNNSPNINDERYDPDEATTNFGPFVTRNRGSIDDMDDFTLCFNKPKVQRNHHFDINELNIPVLEKPIGLPTVVNDPDTEITTTVQNVTQNMPASTFSKVCIDETVYENVTFKLPRISDVLDVTTKDSPLKNIEINSEVNEKRQERKTSKRLTITDSSEDKSNERTSKKKKQKKDKTEEKDPSAAKVVLQKLAEQCVKKKSSTLENYKEDEDLNQRSRSIISNLDFSSDSESSNSSYNHLISARPKRQKAPTNLQEPSLQKKLRRPK